MHRQFWKIYVEDVVVESFQTPRSCMTTPREGTHLRPLHFCSGSNSAFLRGIINLMDILFLIFYPGQNFINKAWNRPAFRDDPFSSRTLWPSALNCIFTTALYKKEELFNIKQAIVNERVTAVRVPRVDTHWHWRGHVSLPHRHRYPCSSSPLGDTGCHFAMDLLLFEPAEETRRKTVHNDTEWWGEIKNNTNT